MNDLEILRRKNIERNKELLKELKLDSISASIVSTTKSRTKPLSRPKAKVNKAIPTRRSKRLLKNPEDAKERALEEENASKELESQEKLKILRTSKLNGDYRIQDLLADARLGELVSENFVHHQSKTVYVDSDSESEGLETDPKTQNQLSVLHQIGERMAEASSTMDEETISSHATSTIDRKCFSDSELHSLTDPSQVKLTPHRITSIMFHPSTTDRVAFAGDTNGCLGIWAVDKKTEEGKPFVVNIKPHGRTISRIADLRHKLTHVATASYDGSCRVIDLSKQMIAESFAVEDELENFIGISDIQCPSEHMIYATTLNGLFLMHDTRQDIKKIKYKSLTRLHDKKIGGFSVNPCNELQIATASLDRTLKIWDLRNVSRRNSSSEILDGLASPSTCGEYYSKLSISNVDWNSNQHLVCNGYDDSIRLFDISGQNNTHTSSRRKTPTRLNSLKNELTVQQLIRHNCQTGRWVSILKSRWQRSPADGIQKFAIGNMNRSIDIFGEDGRHITSLLAPDVMTAIPAVVGFHPTSNWVIGGTSSGKVFVFN